MRAKHLWVLALLAACTPGSEPTESVEDAMDLTEDTEVEADSGLQEDSELDTDKPLESPWSELIVDGLFIDDRMYVAWSHGGGMVYPEITFCADGTAINMSTTTLVHGSYTLDGYVITFESNDEGDPSEGYGTSLWDLMDGEDSVREQRTEFLYEYTGQNLTCP